MTHALSIAGFDPCGGAGVTADVNAMRACGVWGASVITAYTVQNTLGVRDAVEIPPELVVPAIDALFDDITFAAIKTGMLSSAEMVEAVAACLKRRAPNIPLVVDPVLAAGDGFPLLEDDGFDALKRFLFPLTTVITPNLPEAETLTGTRITSLEEMKHAAAELAKSVSAVVLKGGHAEFAKATDVLFHDGEAVVLEPSGPPLERDIHGTGCVFASGIAAGLARGQSIPDAVVAAKRLVERAIAGALDIGKGKPVAHIPPPA